ncbi:MAG: (2Fe-2S)-binding protein [Gammaproteobacteria bacterium]|nr:(2Fe-2S)-binding protein [Gammaproteobacteria bacterium]NNL50909.1 (2Fe-2S)-binding protein [Woeseiaceae bacterium]
MYVCVCNAITDRQIRKAAADDVRSFPELQQRLGVAAGCGCCRDFAAEILADSQPGAGIGSGTATEPA